MKAAVVFYSQSGNTRLVAEKMAQILGADLVPLTPKKKYPDSGFKKFFWGGKSAMMGEKPALEPYVFHAKLYDTVVLGTPVWAGTIAPPLRSFIAENKKALQGKAVALFACCSGGPGKAMEKAKKALDRDALLAELILIDPKDKPTPENEARIAAFCDKLKG